MGVQLLFMFILSTSFFIQVCADEPHNDLLPLARLESTARFFDDEAAFPVLWEFGNRVSRINASLGFPLCYGHNFKFGGEALNEQLTYDFPHEREKRWVLQSAVGMTYQSILNFCGMRSLEISAQYSTAPNRQLHTFHKKKPDHHNHRHHGHNHHDHHNHPRHHHSKACGNCSAHQGHQHHQHHHHQRDHEHADRLHDLRHHHHHREHHREGFKRSIAGSRAYAFSAALTTVPWNGAFLSASALYDHVDFQFKYSDHKIVDGLGGTIFYKQELCPCFDLVLKSEFRVPYTYYEGRLQWGLTFYSADMTLGLYGGHTVGRHGLPDSTVAGVEIGFDFGLTNFSGYSSGGLCKDNSNPYFAGFAGQDVQYLQWLATPAVYIPEVIARPEQRHFKK